MNLCYVILAISNFIALNGETRATDESVPFRSVDRLLTDFDEVTQQIAKQESVKHFVNRIDHGKVHTKNALDIYTSATKNILDWCDSTTPLFNQVINAHDDNKSKLQLSPLATTLNDGTKRMQASQTGISKSNSNFNHVIRVIDRVFIHIAADFNNKTNEFKEENRKFYELLETKVQNLNTDIDNLKNQLKIEVQIINNLKIQTAVTKGFLVFDEYPELYDELRDDILKSVDKLNAGCNNYRKRHE